MKIGKILCLSLLSGCMFQNEPTAYLDCTKRLICGNERVSIEFSEHPQTMKPFNLSVQRANTEKIFVEFTMPDMDMGENRYRLIKKDKKAWQAKVILPACVSKNTAWIMDVEAWDTLTQRSFLYRVNFQITDSAHQG